MHTRKDPLSLYSYSSHNSTRNPSVVSKSPLLLHEPQQYSHPRLPRYAIHQGQILGAVMPQDHAHTYLYGHGPNSPTSFSLHQPTSLTVANPHLYNNSYHVSDHEQSKGPHLLSGLVSQQWRHDQEQASPLPTPPSNDSPWAYRLRPLGQLPTSSPRRQELYAANMSWGAGPSGLVPLLCS